MKEAKAQEIFDCIKKDDIKKFEEIIKERKSCMAFCYGRFPILSLVYLYKARKIAAKFQDGLNAVSTYITIQEPIEAYNKFRKIAGRGLRLYAGEEKIIEPVEMLAIADETDYLEENYNKLKKTAETKNKLKTIYSLSHGRVANLSSSGLTVEKKEPPFYQKLILIIAPVFACIMIFISAITVPIISNKFGAGTENNPVRIYNTRQLAAAGQMRYVLENSLTLPADWELDNFNGLLDGKGFTINCGKRTFASEISGTVANVNFIFEETEIEIENGYGLVCAVNNGSLQNVSVSFSGIIKENSSAEKLTAGGFTGVNNGVISGSKIDLKIAIEGDADGDALFGGFAGVNNGQINSCSSLSGSFIAARTFDAGGFTAENGADAVIADCKNYIEISHSSDSEQWTPNAAGIAAINNGKIRNSFNYGNIYTASGYEDNKVRGSVCSGGVAAINNGIIEKCKNDANITVETKYFYAYAGGITALNESAPALIQECGAFGKIAVISPNAEGVYAFLGGITGYAAGGKINDSFAGCKYNAGSNQEYPAGIAGMVGGWRDWSTTYLSVVMQNNFYIVENNIGLGINKILINNYLYDYKTDFNGTVETQANNLNIFTVADIDALKLTQVYWE